MKGYDMFIGLFKRQLNKIEAAQFMLALSKQRRAMWRNI